MVGFIKRINHHIIIADIQIINNKFSHTAMMGLFVTTTSDVVMDSNVFTDIGILH